MQRGVELYGERPSRIGVAFDKLFLVWRSAWSVPTTGTYELRRVAVLREIEQHSVTSARRLAASVDVIEEQVAEAGETG